MNPLANACEVWQSGRDGGSTPLRAAARILTGVPHYFSAPYIDALDAAAATDETAHQRARLLLNAVNSSRARTADDWRTETGLTGPPFACRGISSKNDHSEDDQIERLVAATDGTISMPLWGFSLSEEMARSFGTRFMFRVHGTFHAIAAWHHSGIKPEEQELIGSGVYRILSVEHHGGSLVVDLQESSAITPL